MSSTALDPRFILAEATVADVEECMNILELALATDANWKISFAACKSEDIHKWVMNEKRRNRRNMPDMSTWKIVDQISGYPNPAHLMSLYELC